MLGTVNGVAVGDDSVNDTFSGVVLPRPDSLAENYNFGERPAADGGVQPGQTATIGFWQNKNGQNLIKALNGGLDRDATGQLAGRHVPEHVRGRRRGQQPGRQDQRPGRRVLQDAVRAHRRRPLPAAARRRWTPR